jgi:hypothetical protein
VSRIKNALLFVCGAIGLGLAAQCLIFAIESGMQAILSESLPVDTRWMLFLSLFVSSAFFALLGLGGLLSIYHGMRVYVTGGKPILVLTAPALVSTFILLALSILVLADSSATSKITWEELRGAPLPFLSVTELRGPCMAGAIFWKCRSIENLEYAFLAIDALGFYYAVSFCRHAVNRIRAANTA